MRSMTGFGQGQAVASGISVQVEISSVNRKNLDVHFSLPRGMSALESRCQKLISETCVRGRVQAKVLIETVGESEAPVTLNEDKAREWLKKLNTFAEAEGLVPVTNVMDVLRFPRVLSEAESTGEESPDIWPTLEEALRSALAELAEMRKVEGAHLQKVLFELCAELEALVEEVLPLLPEAREELSERIKQAVVGLGDLSPEMQNRVVQEIALQAERSDVQEEVDRLAGHLQQMRDKLGQTEAVGRALDFICQELARELNTLSVKASRADINRLALAGKETVEKIREQVQNVE
ncbi:YicC family protein [Kiritimatiellaeota bacterium B1221]|nr:YicC family protein [Kiritimatiellaeota bacterium B1221]